MIKIKNHKNSYKRQRKQIKNQNQNDKTKINIVTIEKNHKINLKDRIKNHNYYGCCCRRRRNNKNYKPDLKDKIKNHKNSDKRETKQIKNKRKITKLKSSVLKIFFASKNIKLIFIILIC
jgi:hypothetical protein